MANKHFFDSGKAGCSDTRASGKACAHPKASNRPLSACAEAVSPDFKFMEAAEEIFSEDPKKEAEEQILCLGT